MWWWCRPCNENHSLSFTLPILFFNENTKAAEENTKVGHVGHPWLNLCQGQRLEFCGESESSESL